MSHPNECTITHRGALACEPALRSNLLWACHLDAHQYQYESAYTNNPLRSSDPTLYDGASPTFFKRLATSRISILTRFLNKESLPSAGDYVRSYWPEMALALVVILISLWCALWFFPRRTKYWSRARTYANLRDGSPRDAGRRSSKRVLFVTEVLLSALLVFAITGQLINVSDLHSDYKVMNCITSKNVYRLVYGDFLPARQIHAPEATFEGFVRLYSSVDAIAAMSLDSIISTTKIRTMMRTSLRSLWGPVWHTDANLGTTRYLAMPAFHGDYGATALRHRLAIAAAFELNDRFKWSQTYASHITVLDEISSMAVLPSELIRLFEEALHVGDEVIEPLKKYIDQILESVDLIRSISTSFQEVIYGERSRFSKALRVLPPVFIMVQVVTCLTILVVEQMPGFRRSKPYHVLSSIQAIVSAACVLIGIAVLCGLSISADFCTVVQESLLGQEDWNNYRLISDVAVRNLIPSCMFGNASGSVLEAVEADKPFSQLRSTIKEFLSVLYDAIATQDENFFWGLSEPTIPPEIQELAEHTYGISWAIPDVISFPGLFVMSDPRIIWSVPNNNEPVRRKIADGSLHKWIEEALLAQWSFAQRHYVLPFPSHNSTLLWASDPAGPTIYTAHDATLGFREIVPQVCASFAQSLCVSWDISCPESGMVGADSFMYIPEELFRDEHFLLTSAQISRGYSNINGLERDGVPIETDGVSWRFYGWKAAVRDTHLVALFDCLTENSSQISAFEAVNFLMGTYQVILKSLITDRKPLLRAWVYPSSNFTNRAVEDYYEICEAVRECPLFVSPGTSSYNQLTPPDLLEVVEGAHSDLTEVFGDFQLTEYPLFEQMLPGALQKASAMRNRELSTFTQRQLVRTNPVYSLWKSVEALPTTQNCTVARSFVKELSSAGCSRAAPALFNLSGWVLGAGLIGLGLTMVHIMRVV